MGCFFHSLEEVRDEFGNTAYDYLNKTRLRAGMPAISATDVPAGKPLREAILRERAIEFGYEEVRYFDLVRWKRADIFTGQLSRLIIKKAAGEPSGFSYAVSHAMAETRQYAKPEKWNDKYFLLSINSSNASLVPEPASRPITTICSSFPPRSFQFVISPV